MRAAPDRERSPSPARPPNSRVVVYLRTDQRKRLLRTAERAGLSTSFFVARQLVRAGVIEP